MYAIYKDKRQHLWISSDFGIIQFDKNSFQTHTYLKQDGITNNEFNRTSRYQDENGHIYFGGLNGITSFDPEEFYLQKQREDAPLVITDFQQFVAQQNKLVDLKSDLLKNKEIVLRPNDRFFNLSFSLLSYQKPELVRYAYRIENWDEDWRTLAPYGQAPLWKATPKNKSASSRWSLVEK